MTAAAWTICQPIAGVQQPNVTSTVQKHPLGTRINAVSAGIEWRFIYGKSTAVLAKDAAATYDPATGNIAAGAASAIDGTVVVACAVDDFVWLKIANET